MSAMNKTGKHKPKRRHHGTGSVLKRTDHWRARPWAAVVPYLDSAGRRREMWLSAGSRDEAERLLRDELARIRKGIIPTAETVGQYMTAWLATVEVGPGTWPRYRQHLTERIMPSFGDVALDRLTPQAVRSALYGWQGSPQTRGGTLRLLRAAMKQAVADRRIEHDPTAGIAYPRIPRHEPVTLTGPQARHLMATVKGERFAPILVLSLGLGVRRGEALGLRTKDINWEDDDGSTAHGEADPSQADGGTGRHSHLCRRVDASSLQPSVKRPGDRDGDGGPGSESGSRRVSKVWLAGSGDEAGGMARRPVSVTIAKSLRYIAPAMRAEGEDAYRLTGTKTGETREVPLPRFVAEMLEERLAERERELRAAKVWAGNDFVFCTPVGNSIALQSLYAWFKRALVRAGLPDMRYHDLRASTLTLLVDMGVDLLTIQRIAGHRDLATTRLYVGKTPAAMRHAADKIGEAMG